LWCWHGAIANVEIKKKTEKKSLTGFGKHKIFAHITFGCDAYAHAG
jgi:hypothetical protein